MKVWEQKPVNDEGHLLFGGCDTVALAKQYGTPLYLMDEDRIREACRAFRRTFAALGVDGMALYASKAFSTLAIYRIVAQEGLGVDVVSEGELRTALAAGTNPADIYFHGNNKTEDDIAAALDAGVGSLVIDAFEEIEAIAALARERSQIARVSVRVKPGVEAHTHEYITTGSDDSKFGFGLADGCAMRAVEAILAQPSLKLIGLHYHIGSQVFEREPYALAADRTMHFVRAIRDTLGFEIEEINLGGGFGIHYVDADAPIEAVKHIQMMVEVLRTHCDKYGLPLPRIKVEPGRSIVGEAGLALYTVGTVKELPGIRTYVSVDGGMADNPRYALYQAEYSACLANRPHDANETTVTVAGRCCESGDILTKNVALPACRRGDTLAIFTAGAYQYAMASNYNRLRRPAVLLVRNGQAAPIVERESYEQIMQNDRLPDWLG